ncbi:MAG TPA: hypothetical protein VI365_27465 [Trebonia sp.]
MADERQARWLGALAGGPVLDNSDGGSSGIAVLAPDVAEGGLQGRVRSHRT